MNAAQNGMIFGLPNNYGINNQNMNANQNFMNPSMMMGNQNMMMGNQNMMMGNQNMMMGNPNMMMANPNMMMGNPNMMMGNPNMMMGNPNIMMGNPNMMMANPNMMMNNQNINQSNMGINNNTNTNSNTNNETKKEDDMKLDDKDEILPRNLNINNVVNPVGGDIINVVFELSNGSKIVIDENINSPFKVLAKKFCQKININEKYIHGRIKFLFLSKLIDEDSNQILKDMSIKNFNTIIVYDDYNVIGT